jgi:hypothetical protein
MSAGTVPGELLLAPHSARACPMTFACEQCISTIISSFIVGQLYIAIMCARHDTSDSKSRCGWVDLK